MDKTIHDNVVYQFRRFYVRENKNGCCPILITNMGTDSGLYKLAGNAITVPIIELIIKEILGLRF